MREQSLFVDERSLFEKLCDLANLGTGFEHVRRNGGSPGIDGVTIKQFQAHLDEELARLKNDLESWRYKPAPVRRVEIPKPGKGKGVRLLGVPCVRDRVVHATLKLLLEPIFDPTFSEHSYGFRPGCSPQKAVEAARRIIKSGKEYVIDIDLSKFFDRVNHDRLIFLLSGRVTDKRILRLIGMILRSGVMAKGTVQVTKEGTVQGSPLSPLLSNVIRNIFVRSPKAANRVMDSISRFIENKLKLKINWDKSKVGRSQEVKFLGMTVVEGTLAISVDSMKRARQKIRELTCRGTCLSIENTVDRINRWYTGWSGYYLMTQYPFQFHAIEGHIRRRLRARIIYQQKRRRHLYRRLLKHGVPKKAARNATYSNDGIWALSKSYALNKAYPNKKLIYEWGLKIRSKDRMKHWFSPRQWVPVL